MTKRAIVTAIGVLIAGSAAAADLATSKAPPAPPPSWWSTITVNGEIDAGIMGNPDNPGSGLNWGRLFDEPPTSRCSIPGISRSNGRPIRMRLAMTSASSCKATSARTPASFTISRRRIFDQLEVSARSRAGERDGPYALDHSRRYRLETRPVADARRCRILHRSVRQPVLFALLHLQLSGEPFPTSAFWRSRTSIRRSISTPASAAVTKRRLARIPATTTTLRPSRAASA